MIVLDTHALIHATLAPERLGQRARDAIQAGASGAGLALADISLWEVGMLVAKGRLDVGCELETFLRDALLVRRVRVLPITPEIAATACRLTLHGDPADRLIVATALQHGAALVTADARIADSGLVNTIW